MTLQNAKPRSLALRATDGWSISEGMPEPRRNVLEKLLAALLSWLRRPKRPPDVPDYLRADLGLPPVEDNPYLVPPNPDYALLAMIWLKR
ncbi:hypothetical protein [Devosia geojensis]|nr:hypothetical protein [Devosia geojensis]